MSGAPCHKQSQISAHFDGNHTVEPLSDTHGWVICQRLALAALFGQPRKNFQRNHSVFLKPSAFRGCARFTATVSIRQRHVGLVTKEDDAGVHKGTRNRFRGL